jgi:hypothetical protein
MQAVLLNDRNPLSISSGQTNTIAGVSNYAQIPDGQRRT